MAWTVAPGKGIARAVIDDAFDPPADAHDDVGRARRLSVLDDDVVCFRVEILGVAGAHLKGPVVQESETVGPIRLRPSAALGLRDVFDHLAEDVHDWVVAIVVGVQSYDRSGDRLAVPR